MLFICTTLWHEEDNEMEQLLNSLGKFTLSRSHARPLIFLVVSFLFQIVRVKESVTEFIKHSHAE